MREYLCGIVKGAVYTNAYSLSAEIIDWAEQKRAGVNHGVEEGEEDLGAMTSQIADIAIGSICISEAVAGNYLPIAIYGGLKIGTNGAAFAIKTARDWLSNAFDAILEESVEDSYNVR